MNSFVTQYVSLDLWDTVLRRKCHPDEVKLYTAQRMLHLLSTYLRHNYHGTLDLLVRRQRIEAEIGSFQCKIGFDDEYEIEEVLRSCILDVIESPLDEKELTKITNLLVQAEIEQEISVTYLDQELISFLSSCEFEKLFIISDFYMSSEKVKTIFRAHSFPYAVETLFLSCDMKLNKRSGRLFKYVCSTLDIKPESLLHIGDNQFADVEMATSCGVRALHFTGMMEMEKRQYCHDFFSKRQKMEKLSDTILLAGDFQATSPFLKKSQERESLRSYGRYMSPLFTGFALNIQEQCCRGEHERVYFFTREGKFLKNVFDQAQVHGLFSMKMVESHLLPVSRLATFFPSLQDLTPEQMMRLWSQYHTQSVNSFLQSLGINPINFLDGVKGCDIDPEEMISSPWQDERFRKLFADTTFLSKLKREYWARRENLTDFFEECKFGQNGKACIVDIGWRGTIQDNLALTFPSVFIEGCYLGLNEFFNPQPSNTQKYGYIGDKNKGEDHIMFKHVMPYEMLCFSTGGSAVGYRRDNSGKMVAQFKCDTEEDYIHNERIQYFQEGVVEGVNQVCKTVAQHGISIQELRKEARILAENFLISPPIVMCRAFNALKQDDTFGMAQTIYPGESSFRLTDRLLTYFSQARRDRFLSDLENSGWPQCMLRTRYFGIFYLLGRLKKMLPGH
ncbi:MAG: hypothetical protein GY705_11900 [Bacteroidetes bacterium]|nr:hypothetical protein [Bacteroidota bacterium]